jgi:hypothetical protein
MKNDSRPFVRKMSAKNSEIWTAEINTDHVSFHKTPETMIEFRNSLDVWDKMTIAFRNRIQGLRVSPERKSEPSEAKTAEATRYSVRYQLD